MSAEGKKTDGAKGAAAASRQPQQQPAKSKGKKQKKQTLSEFLGGNTGTTGSWADDDEDEFMHQPERPTETAQSAGDWRGGGPARQEPAPHRPFANLAQGTPKALPDRPPYTLYIGNLVYSTTEEEIAAFFGNTESVRLVFDKATNQSKGFGYVSFSTREALAQALKLHDQPLGGRAVRLDVAQDNRSGGKGGKGGFGDSSSGFGGGGGFGGSGRDFMGTGQVERGGGKGMDRDGSRGGFGGGGGSWGEGGRDFMGSGQVENRPAREGPSGGRGVGYGGGRNERRGFGGDSGESWSSGREAMGTGVIEDRAPPLREDRPPREAPSFSRDDMAQEQPAAREIRNDGDRPRGAPSRLMFGNSDSAPSRNTFGAEDVPERPERPPKSEPWRPGGRERGADRPELGDGGSWRSGPDPDINTRETTGASKPAPFKPRMQQTNEDLEKKKDKKPPQIPQTQEELFQKQLEKAKRKEQQEAKAKTASAGQSNLNPWEALGSSKKKKKKKTTEED